LRADDPQVAKLPLAAAGFFLSGRERSKPAEIVVSAQALHHNSRTQYDDDLQQGPGRETSNKEFLSLLYAATSKGYARGRAKRNQQN
jgi:hypothetical protein